MKKCYIAPEMDVVVLEAMSSLMQGSSQGVGASFNDNGVNLNGGNLDDE